MKGYIKLFFIFSIPCILNLSNLFLPFESHGQTQDITATGVAAILQGDKAIARDTALNDALRKAVEQAVGAMVSSETVVENYQLIRDSILTKSQGYIQKYRVASESPSAELYQVTISATVSLGNLKNDLAALGILMQRVQKPRVLFMIAEQNVGQEFYIFWWYGKSEFKGQQVDLSVSETALKEEFLSKGFNVVDSSVATGRIEISNAYRIADLADAGAISIGRQLGAEVIVKGKALAKEGPRTAGSKVGSYIADITATAFRVDNGSVIGSGRGHGVSRNISGVTGGTEAIEKAAREMAGKMVDQIVAKWSGEVSGGGLVQLTVRGIGEYSDFVKFKDIIQGQIRGVQAIYQRSLEAGTAVLDIDMKGNAQSLADEIARKNFGGIPVKVLGASANTVEVSLGGAPSVKVIIPPPTPPPTVEAKVTPLSAPQLPSPLEADEYLVFGGEDDKSGWVGKMLTSPTATNPEGEFLHYAWGKKEWGRFFKQIRPSTASELTLGSLVYFFDGNIKDGVYYFPTDKAQIRRGGWWRDVVTDTSMINTRGIVTVGDWKVDISSTFVEKK
ncbi:MAG: flagellar assembly protein T N-terminal domain-containing protein [Nitrospinae bacterium]|nr:flagellar assembly protein T N-terminal domain-containing protein [Nitrospinota bacterium]